MAYVYNNIGIVYHPLNKAAHKKALELDSFIKEQGLNSCTCSAWKTDDLKKLAPKVDLLVTTGGDGTILRVAQASIDTEIPITSVNLGKVGFMTEIPAEHAFELLPKMLKGEGIFDERTVLDIKVCAGGSEEDGTKYHALNDVVVSRGSIARVINVEALINGEHLATYKADGVIASTATGSTGYSMAAGGPIIYPQSPDILLTPIVPHLSMPYVTMLPHDAEITLKLHTTHQATLCVDGHIHKDLANGDVIKIKTSEHKVRFLRLTPKDEFFSLLESKLKRGK